MVTVRPAATLAAQRRWLLAHHLEAAAGHHHPTPAAAGEYIRLAKRGLAGARVVCNKWSALKPEIRTVSRILTITSADFQFGC